nr:hypothetical protein [Tanacetum cinerariifolium]
MGLLTRAIILIGMAACLASVANAIAGQATYYTVYTPSLFYGPEDKGTMIAAANSGLFANKAACGRRNGVSKLSHAGEKDSIDLQPKKPYLAGEKANNVMTWIKDINALSNLYVIFTNEVFGNVKLTYLGSFWVLIDVASLSSKEKFLKHVGVAAWFTELLPATNSFVSKVRLVWIYVECLPIKSWTSNTFVKIVSPWGVLSAVDVADVSSLPFKRLCMVTKPHIIINDMIKVIIKGQAYWIRVMELEAWSPDFNNEFCEDSLFDDESVDEEVDHVSDTHDKGADFDKEEEVDFVLDSTSTNDKGDDDLDKEKKDDYFKSSFDMNVNSAVLNNHGSSSKLKPNSEDPFRIYELLNMNKNKQDSMSKDLIFHLALLRMLLRIHIWKI